MAIKSFSESTFAIALELVRNEMNSDVSSEIAHRLVNQAESGKDSEYIYQKLSVLAGRFLKNVPFFAGYLTTDQLVTDSVTRQNTVIEIAPDTTIADQFSTLCRFLTEELSIGPENNKINVTTGMN